MATVHSFEELECWKHATELRREVSRILKKFPSSERFELISQIKRAVRSVTNNIAEGYGRYHYQEFIQFCRISRGSLTELLDHLIIAADEGYLEPEDFSRLKNKIDSCLALLNGFISYLKSKAPRSEGREPEMITWFKSSSSLSESSGELYFDIANAPYQ